MPNRSQAPFNAGFPKITFHRQEVVVLSNLIPVTLIRKGDQPVVKMEWVFKGGRWTEPQKVIARFTNQLLKEGSRNYTAAQINETLDFYGATLKSDLADDHASLVLTCLTKHIEPILRVVADIILNPTFPNSELDLLRAQKKQALEINLKKTEYLADQAIQEALFGSDHPFGYDVSKEDYDLIHSSNLSQYHQQAYHPIFTHIFVAGLFDDTLLKQLDELFGHKEWAERPALQKPFPKYTLQNRQEIHQSIPNSQQASIRLGQYSILRRDADYPALSVLITILGGYFGSRLMTNIREDKGYTYGIYASLGQHIQSGSLTIQAEVGLEIAKAAIQEVYHEIHTLQQISIEEEELDLVRHYLMGKILQSVDGAFAMMRVYKQLALNEQDIDYFYRRIEIIQHITPEQLLTLAQNHLKPEEMHEICVG